MAISNLQSLLGSAIVLAALYLITQRTLLARSRAAFARQHNCQPIPAFPQKRFMLGIDLIRSDAADLAAHRLLPSYVAETMRYSKILDATFDKSRPGWQDDSPHHPPYGKVYTFTADLGGGYVRNILTADPDNLRAMQATDFASWAIPQDRIAHGGALLGKGIFTSNGADWQRSRDLLRPNFSREHVRDLALLEAHVQHLIQRVPRDKATVDLQGLFFGLTLDSATELLFGESTGTLAPGLATRSASGFARALMKGTEEVFRLIVLGPLSGLASKKTLRECATTLQDFADEYVERGFARKRALAQSSKSQHQQSSSDLISGSSGRYNFLDELVAQTDDKVRIRSELLNILVAGRDTTASLLSNVWWLLSKHPSVWARLRAEVDALHGKVPDFDDMRQMRYLRAVLNETLRLYPVVPLNGRQALRDTILPRGGGPDGQAPCFVPAGTVCNFSVWVMHRRPDLYGPDADAFRPERWIENGGLRPGWEYLPFNGGARVCLGQQFALTEASYVTTRLMQEFRDIESRDDQPWTEWITLTVVGLHGCKVALTPVAP